MAGIVINNVAQTKYDYDLLNLVYIENTGIIEKTINYGNIIQNSKCPGPTYEISGIVQESRSGIIKNNINMGNIISNTSYGLAGIVVRCADVGGDFLNNAKCVKNCLNTGKIIYNQNIFAGYSSGIIISSDILSNSLNIGYVDNSAILYIIDDFYFLQNGYDNTNNNYYDKQMCLVGGINGEDIEGKAEGRLTTQLVGTSPELQAMLGDGWSYAEGRYPIPLGLEDDTLALLAATPIYLDYENDNNYNDVEYVIKNFTVGTEHGVTWSDSLRYINFDGENAILTHLGETEITATLNGYNKKVKLNIVALETTIISQEPTTINIEAYPNPTSEFINLQLNDNQFDKVEIYDLSGRLLLTQTVKSNELKLFVGNLQAGTYVVSLYEDGDRKASVRFVRE